MTQQDDITQRVLTAEQDPINAAILLLTEEADSISDCHTRTPGDWAGEPEAKAHYDHVRSVVDALSKLRAPVADERSALAELLEYVDRNTCTHEDTHRGGAIWTICDGCGMKWADDEGGFAPHQDAPAVAAARAALASAPVTGLPERDATKAAEDQGLFRKFDVRRTDGSDQPGGKHHGCRYFVLDVDHDPHASAALGAYAAACERTHPALASDLREKWGAPLAGEATDGRQALLEAIHRYGNARAMAEHNIAYRDEVRNTADALLALFDAAPQASAEDDREALAHKVNLLTAESLGHRSAAGHLSALVDELSGHLIEARQAMADFQQAFVPAFDTPETLTMVPNEALAPFCAALDRLCELDLPQADKDGGQQREGVVTDDMRYAVRFAPSSAHWSERLKEFFGPDAREGIDALESQLREARAMLDRQPKLRADASAVRRALIAASNYIDTLGGDSKSYRAALSAPQAEQGERDA